MKSVIKIKVNMECPQPHLLAKMSKVIIDEYDKTNFSQPLTNF